MNIKRTDKYNINWYDSDCFGRLSFPGFTRFIEESAWRHANELGFGLNDTQDAGIVWVIVRLEIDIVSIPAWGDVVSITTWPRGVDRLFAYREFEIHNANGDVQARATSTWIVIDSKLRKAVKPSIVESVLPYVDRTKVMGRNADRLHMDDSKQLCITRNVVFSDIDTNGHVNNCKYLEWVIDLMDVDDLKNIENCNVSLNFVNELLPGDSIRIYKSFSDDAYVFEGIAVSSEKTVFIIKFLNHSVYED